MLLTLSSIHELTRLPDGLDLLLRLRTHRLSPPHPRLLRPAQRRSTLTKQPLHVTTPTPTGHHPVEQSPTTNVQRKPACGLRNIVSRNRIRRRRSRTTKQSISISIPSASFHAWCVGPRHRRGRKPATDRVRLPISREGHLQLRGEPRRQQRGVLRKTRNPRSLRRQRTLVASEEGERRQGHHPQQLCMSSCSKSSSRSRTNNFPGRPHIIVNRHSQKECQNKNKTTKPSHDRWREALYRNALPPPISLPVVTIVRLLLSSRVCRIKRNSQAFFKSWALGTPLEWKSLLLLLLLVMCEYECGAALRFMLRAPAAGWPRRLLLFFFCFCCFLFVAAFSCPERAFTIPKGKNILIFRSWVEVLRRCCVFLGVCQLICFLRCEL
jgi:hypothetical protein